MTRTSITTCLALILYASLAVSPAVSADGEKEVVVDSVLSMLEAGLTEDVILAWIDSGEEAIPRPRADQLIALQEAGASGTLLKRLLSAPKTSTQKEETLIVTTPADSPTPPKLPPSPEVELEASAKLPSKRVPRKGTQQEQDFSAGEIMVNFTFSYSPWYLNDDEFDFANDSWDFFVYLDGIPVSYVPAAAMTGTTSNLEFSQLVPAGRHVIRATLEQHKRGRGDQWTHSARVAEESFIIIVSPDGPQASVSVRFKENWGGLGRGGPLDFSFQQAGEISELDGVGGNPEDWPLICEEVESNWEGGKSTSDSMDRQLRGCVEWGSLWDGASAPPRREVREALALFEYRPVPKGS